MDCCVVPAGTPVEIELTEPVSSRSAKAGDRFAIRLSNGIQFQGRTVMSGSGSGYGEVVDAAPAGVMGRPGKLVLVARAVDVGGAHLRLRGFSLPAEGHDASKAAMTIAAVPYAGVLAFGMTVGNVEYAAGAHAMVKLAADAVIPAAAPTDDVSLSATAPSKDQTR